jgi:hypothetical protein
MNWNLEGKRVNGLYMGAFPYTGRVVESRVKYGGSVQHTVVVDRPFQVFGAFRDVVLVSITEINRVLDERDATVNDSWYEDQFEVDSQ